MDQLLSIEDQKNILKESLGKYYPPISCEIQPLSEILTGFLGQHFKITLRYDDNGEKSEKYFLKVLNGGFKIIFEISLALDSYEKEEFIYMQLLPEMQQLNIPVDFAPKGLLCKPYLIVLEDMSLKGFKLFPNKLCFDMDHLTKAIETLARFHTSGAIFEHVKSEKGPPFSLYESNRSRFADKLFTGEKNLCSKWFECSIEGLFLLIRLILKNEKERAAFCGALEMLLKKLQEDTKTDFGFSTMLHGDLWSNNFLFAYDDNGKPKESVLVDYQLLNFGPPAKDLIHLIMSNTSRQFREENLTYLLDYYYQYFSNCLIKWNMNAEKLLPRGHFLHLCKEFQPFIKLFCVCDRFITCMPEEFMLKHSTTDEDLRKNYFEDRAKNVLYCFQNYTTFRNLITDDVIELRDILCNLQ